MFSSLDEILAGEIPADSHKRRTSLGIALALSPRSQKCTSFLGVEVGTGARTGSSTCRSSLRAGPGVSLAVQNVSGAGWQFRTDKPVESERDNLKAQVQRDKRAVCIEGSKDLARRPEMQMAVFIFDFYLLVTPYPKLCTPAFNAYKRHNSLLR